MKWSALLLAVLSVNAAASRNPDGSPWTPSLQVLGGVDQAYVPQQATLSQPGYVPTSVNASVSDYKYLGAHLTLPVADWLSLHAQYVGSGQTLSYDFVEGPYQWDQVDNSTQTQLGMGATLFSGAWFTDGPLHWGQNSNPDGWYWYPVLDLHYYSSSVQAQETVTDEVANAVLRTYTDNFVYTQGQADLTLPLPDYYSAFGYYGKDLWRQATYSASPSSNFSDGGDEAWWGFGAKAWYNMDGGDKDRAWNPDGKEQSVSLALSYGEFWAAQTRETQAYQLSGVYVASSWLSVAAGLNLQFYDTVPYNTRPGLEVDNQSTGMLRVGGNLQLNFYIPGTLDRPWDPTPN